MDEHFVVGAAMGHFAPVPQLPERSLRVEWPNAFRGLLWGEAAARLSTIAGTSRLGVLVV